MRIEVTRDAVSTGSLSSVRDRLNQAIASFVMEMPEPSSPEAKTYEVVVSFSVYMKRKPTDAIPHDDTALTPDLTPFVMDTLSCSRTPKNKAEHSFFCRARELGYILSKKGWPDFFLFHPKTRHLALVEVKPKRTHNLKQHQKAVMLCLAAFGVPCFKWTPSEGFTRIGLQAPHGDETQPKSPPAEKV